MFDQPARQIKPKAIGYRGKEPFLKTGDMIPWDSFLERDYIRLADFALGIDELHAQAECINYLYLGKKREYYPDFKVVTADHRVILAEVKPNKFINKEENRVKFLAGRKFCEKKGWSFIVMDEDQIRPGYLQQNLALLRGLATNQISDSMLDDLIKSLKRVDNSTIGELRADRNDLSDEDYYAAVYQLIYFQEIYADLISWPITDALPICITE